MLSSVFSSQLISLYGATTDDRAIYSDYWLNNSIYYYNAVGGCGKWNVQ